MNVNLHAIIGDVRANIDTISTGTREIAAGNLGLFGRTESQASSMEQIAQAMAMFKLTSTQGKMPAAVLVPAPARKALGHR